MIAIPAPNPPFSPSAVDCLSYSSARYSSEVMSRIGIMGSAAELTFERICLALLLLLFSGGGTSALKLTIVNNCPHTVWPGLQPIQGHVVLEQGGFALATLQYRSIDVPSHWIGRVWGRTGCEFRQGGRGSCQTGDCDGELQCGGKGGKSPTTLAQLSLHHGSNVDYSVSLVDGFNLPLTITPHGGTGQCTVAGCRSPNTMPETCPPELRVTGGDSNGRGAHVIACKSGCEAFRKDVYCCTNHYNSPATCKPTAYSLLFKRACPDAYTYAFDAPPPVHSCVAPDEIKLIFCH